MSNNPVAGKCICPVCLSQEAEVLYSSEGKGKPYVKCDECVSICRTSSAIGARKMIERIRGKVAPIPEAEPEKPISARAPADTPIVPIPPKKKAGFFDMLAES